MDNLFELENIRCSYAKPYIPGKSKIVLDIKHLAIPRGKKVFIVGESGIGKSTILEVLGMMNDTIVRECSEKPSFKFRSGNEDVDLLALWQSNDSLLSAFRKKHFSFIFQNTNLMRNFTAYENIAVTRMLQGDTKDGAYKRVRAVLDSLGLSHVDETRMAQDLSGGQQQRLAFARAIIPDFTVLFGDEPTGNLDSDNAVRAISLLSKTLDEYPGRSAIIVSHDMHLASYFADMVVRIKKKGESVNDEIIYHGEVDDDCVYCWDEENGKWANPEGRYTRETFEQFLRHGENEAQ